MVWKGYLRPASSSTFPWPGSATPKHPWIFPESRHEQLLWAAEEKKEKNDYKWYPFSFLFYIFIFHFLLNQTGDSLVPKTVHLRKCLLSPHFKTKFIWDIFLKWNWSWVSAQVLCEMLTLYKKKGEQISSITTVYKGNCNLDFVLSVSEGQRSIWWVLYVFVFSSTFLRCPTA